MRTFKNLVNALFDSNFPHIAVKKAKYLSTNYVCIYICSGRLLIINLGRERITDPIHLPELSESGNARLGSSTHIFLPLCQYLKCIWDHKASFKRGIFLDFQKGRRYQMHHEVFTSKKKKDGFVRIV